MPKKPIHLLLIASAGGHLKELHELEEFWSKYNHTWVTFREANGVTLLKDEKQIIWASSPTNFPNLWNNIKNTFLAAKVLFSGSYTHIISTGAGVGVPFIWFGWFFSPILKTKTIFIDSLTRTKGISFSMKLVYFFSNFRITQWAHNIEKYKRLVFKGRVL